MRKFKLNDKNNHKIIKFFAISWFLLFLCIGMGYSKYTAQLEVKSLAYVEEHIYDQVYISSMTVDSADGATSLYSTRMDHEVIASVNAPVCPSNLVYKLKIQNTTKYKVYIDTATIKNVVDGNGNNVDNFKVEFLNVTPGVTYIPKNSSMDVLVKVSRSCSGTSTSDSIVTKFDFTYSLYKYFDLYINATPKNALVTLTNATGDAYTDNATSSQLAEGKHVYRVLEGDKVTYDISLKSEHYYPLTGQIIKGYDDEEYSYVLEKRPSQTLVVTSNKEDASVKCNSNDELLGQSTTGTLTATIYKGESLNCQVGYDNPEYYESDSTTETGCSSAYSDNGPYDCGCSIATTVSNNVNFDCTLKDKLGLSVFAANETNKASLDGTVTNYRSGYYLVQMWGGKGGNGYNQSKYLGGDGGDAGTVYGVLYVSYGQKLYYTVGGDGLKGERASGVAGGANGGGKTDKPYGVSGAGGSGGGYTALRENNSDGSIIMLAAGGGGAGGPGGSGGGQKAGDGGAGGNMSSTMYSIKSDFTTITTNESEIIGYLFAGTDGTYLKNATTSSQNKKQIQGRGATNTYGYNSEYSSGDETTHTIGYMLQGGEGVYSGGGGGAGIHGGGGGAQNGSTGYNSAGGGGGNSFIRSTVKFTGLSQNITSMLYTIKPTVDGKTVEGGTIVISWLGKNIP